MEIVNSRTLQSAYGSTYLAPALNSRSLVSTAYISVFFSSSQGFK